MLIAMMILAIVAVALMQSSIIVLQKNLQNEMRDEAVRIAEQRMNEIRSGPGGFDNPNGGLDLVATGGVSVPLPTVTRTIRNVTVGFIVNKRVDELDGAGPNANTKQVTLTVAWTFRGSQYTHAVMSIVRRYGL